MRRTLITAGLVALTLAPCSPAAIAANRPKTKHSTQPSAPSIGVLPVISCNTTYGAGSPPSPFVARQLPTTSSTRGVSFYSNGRLTILAPSGWACSALVAGGGGQKLDVYPPGKPDYATELAPKGAELVEVQGEYTGHIPGSQLVCSLFPKSAAASEVQQDGLPGPQCQTPTGEKTSQLTPDVVAFSDPAGVAGTGTGSGGSISSIGAVMYPQLAFSATDSINVAVLSCTLPTNQAKLCRAIEGDYLVRNPPSYIPQTNQ
jgi:hypothetical protein